MIPEYDTRMTWVPCSDKYGLTANFALITIILAMTLHNSGGNEAFRRNESTARFRKILSAILNDDIR